jgi:hypothetical protein
MDHATKMLTTEKKPQEKKRDLQIRSFEKIEKEMM